MCLALYPQAGSERAGGINSVEQCWEEKCCLCLQRSFSPPLEIRRTWLAPGASQAWLSGTVGTTGMALKIFHYAKSWLN